MDQILLENLEKPKSTSSGNVFNTLLFVLVFSFLAWYVQYHWKRRNLYAMASKMNGPFPLPLIGNALLLAGTNHGKFPNLINSSSPYIFYLLFLEIILCMEKLVSKYKSPVRLWVGQRLYSMVWKPEQLEVVLNKALNKDELYKQTEVVAGTGLFAAPGMLVFIIIFQIRKLGSLTSPVPPLF